MKIQALIDIENPDFAHWYELGVWWAMYGEQQGNGPYDDQYLIGNLTSHIESGWYDEVSYGWFPMIGSEFGMIHGGMIDPATCKIRTSVSLVNLNHPDFTKGYSV